MRSEPETAQNEAQAQGAFGAAGVRSGLESRFIEISSSIDQPGPGQEQWSGSGEMAFHGCHWTVLTCTRVRVRVGVGVRGKAWVGEGVMHYVAVT